MSYSISDKKIENAWGDKGNSIFKAIEPVFKGVGDIRNRKPLQIKSYKNLYLIPGDLSLSNYEDILGDSWSSAKGGSEPAIRIQSAIYRYIKWASEKVKANIVLVDLGPNLGALNRAVLSSSDYFIIPLSPDLFSIKGTENLGNKLVLWQKEWAQCNNAWRNDIFLTPDGKPKFIGYVTQQHNLRSTKGKMTKGWKMFGDRIEKAIKNNIVNLLSEQDQVVQWDDGNYNLGEIPNLHSLIPYSLEAKKPVFNCTATDGLRGAHCTKAKDSAKHFEYIVNKIADFVI